MCAKASIFLTTVPSAVERVDAGIVWRQTIGVKGPSRPQLGRLFTRNDPFRARFARFGRAFRVISRVLARPGAGGLGGGDADREGFEGVGEV